MRRETRRDHDFVDLEMTDPVGRTPVGGLQPELLERPGESNECRECCESRAQFIFIGEYTRILVDAYLEALYGM